MQRSQSGGGGAIASLMHREPETFSAVSVAPAILMLLVTMPLLGACDRKKPDLPAADVQTARPQTVEAPAAPLVPAPLPTLTRNDLVDAVGRAASTYAEGSSDTASSALVGRRFTVRIPFGCLGPLPTEGAQDGAKGLANWSWGPDRKSMQLRMAPADWIDLPALARVRAAGTWEAVEGFWIPRPWLAAERCPKLRSEPSREGTVPASPQTVGLAQVFEVGGSRLGRLNGRAYEHMIRAAEDAPLASPRDAFRMRLEGRVAAFPGGHAIECHAEGPDERPACIVAVVLDRVSYEDDGGSVLSDWRPG